MSVFLMPRICIMENGSSVHTWSLSGINLSLVRHTEPQRSHQLALRTDPLTPQILTGIWESSKWRVQTNIWIFDMFLHLQVCSKWLSCYHTFIVTYIMYILKLIRFHYMRFSVNRMVQTVRSKEGGRQGITGRNRRLHGQVWYQTRGGMFISLPVLYADRRGSLVIKSFSLPCQRPVKPISCDIVGTLLRPSILFTISKLNQQESRRSKSF